MVSREDVRNAYRFILGREPEAETCYVTHCKWSSIAELRRAFLNGDEFRSQRLSESQYEAHSLLSEKHDPLVFFIHIQKTGGTTLYNALRQQYPSDRCSAGHMGSVAALTVGQACYYRLVGGHFDYESTMLLPRDNVKRISIFREPTARLISQYRYLRAHKADMYLGARSDVTMAGELSPKEFFLRKDVRTSLLFHNVYLRTFGMAANAPIKDEADIVGSALGLAADRIRCLDGIGLTEDMAGSIVQICKGVGVAVPQKIESLNITSEMANSAEGFNQVEPIEITEELLRILEPLVVFDRELYRIACEEFFARLEKDTGHGGECAANAVATAS